MKVSIRFRILVTIVFPVMVVFSSFMMIEPAEAAFSKAKYRSKPYCPKGSFFDPRKGGECWSCQGKHRTIFPVTSNKACERRAYEKFKRAKSGKKTRLAWKCKGKWFWDVWKGGRCWSCEGWRRTAYHINSGKACVRRIPPRRYRAKYIRKFGCSKGQFFDPRKGGQCWSCPSGWYRTVNPVTGSKACTNNFGHIFAVDTSGMCKKVVSAMRGGEKGVKRLMASIKKITDPVTKPINQAMGKLTAKMKTPTEMNKLLNNIAKSMTHHSGAMEELKRFSDQVKKNRKKLQSILLNPKLMCEGTPAQINRRLIAGGLRPKLRFRKSGLMDDLFVGTAHAATKRPYAAFTTSVGSQPPPPVQVGFTAGLTFVTDFGRNSGLYFSLGAMKSSSFSVDWTVGAYIFPHADISEFDGVGSLGGEIAFGQGEKIQDLIKKLPARKRIFIPQSFLFSFEPTFKSAPGFGFDWTIVEGLESGGNKLVDVTGSVDWSFKLK